MDIRQLRYFLRICSDGSILKASQNVFITQQALSKIISAMEQEIGAPLFFRSSRGLVPTEIGLQLKKLAQPVVDAMDKLNEEISSAVQLQSNNLSLGVSCGLQYFLPQAGLREFSQTHPDISLFIEESDSRKCEALVATGDYTAALTIGAVENPGLVVVNLLQRQRVAIVPKSSPLASRSALHISDLDGQVLALNINDRCYSRFCAICSQQNVHTTNIRVGDSITMFDFCENQNYIGMTLDYLLQYRRTNLHNIVAIPIDFSEFPYTVNLVANPAQYTRKIVQQFTSLICRGVLSKDEKPLELPYDFSKNA